MCPPKLDEVRAADMVIARLLYGPQSLNDLVDGLVAVFDCSRSAAELLILGLYNATRVDMSQDERIISLPTMRETPSWDQLFLDMARLVATKSKHPDVQVGCVIVGPNNEVLSVGFNGVPRGVQDTTERYTLPQRSLWVEHAERNAIYNAARHGIAIAGCSIYITAPPCADCARAIIQCGLSSITVPKDHGFNDNDDRQSRWRESMKVTTQMLQNCSALVWFHER